LQSSQIGLFHSAFPFPIRLTPRACGGATSQSFVLKTMPPSRRPHHAASSFTLLVPALMDFVLAELTIIQRTPPASRHVSACTHLFVYAETFCSKCLMARIFEMRTIRKFCQDNAPLNEIFQVNRQL
jgi:hypothetical protein